MGIEAAHAAGMKTIALAGIHPAEALKAAGAERSVSTLDEITLELVAGLVAS